jgi:hypothetical protein
MDMEEDIKMNIHFVWQQGETVDHIIDALVAQFELSSAKHSQDVIQVDGTPAFEMKSPHIVIWTDRKNVFTLNPLNNFGEEIAGQIVGGIMTNSPSASHISLHSKYVQFITIN